MEFETTMVPMIPLYDKDVDEVYFYENESDLTCSIPAFFNDAQFVNSQDLEMAKRNAEKLQERSGK